jgi:serine/threonine-protein kinase
MATWVPELLVDRYEVGRLLGAGGMAEVFEGRDRLLARRVAIKVLQSQYARDPSFLLRFKREAQAAASLSHPNIVAVYDTGVQDGTHFIVMEFVAGRTLKDVIRADGPLYPDRAAEIATDVCAALAAAHARGLIHRDVKPGNVMLTADGTVKVMDFGIARATTSETITQTAAVVGTAQYISPEQAQGQTVDFRSDLYSLGCCLYEMLTGTVPFTGATPVAIAYRHVRERPIPLRVLNPDVPEALQAVCLKAMAKLADNRYQTAVELRQDLERFRAGERVLATPLLAEGGAAATTQALPRGDEGQTALLRGTVADRAGRRARAPRARLAWLPWVLVPLAALALVTLIAYAIGRSVSPLAPSPTTATFPVATTSPPTSPPPSTAPPSTEPPSTPPPSTAPPTTAPPSTSVQQLVLVPNVLGRRESVARALLRRAGFQVRELRVPTLDPTMVDRVVLQQPNNVQVPRGTVVTLGIGRRLPR